MGLRLLQDTAKEPLVDDRTKRLFASTETSGDITGDWLQLEESTFDDLKSRDKIRKDVGFQDLKNPQVYDEVAKGYIDDLQATFGIPTVEDAALMRQRQKALQPLLQPTQETSEQAPRNKLASMFNISPSLLTNPTAMGVVGGIKARREIGKRSPKTLKFLDKIGMSLLAPVYSMIDLAEQIAVPLMKGEGVAGVDVLSKDRSLTELPKAAAVLSQIGEFGGKAAIATLPLPAPIQQRLMQAVNNIPDETKAEIAKEGAKVIAAVGGNILANMTQYSWTQAKSLVIEEEASRFLKKQYPKWSPNKLAASARQLTQRVLTGENVPLSAKFRMNLITGSRIRLKGLLGEGGFARIAGKEAPKDLKLLPWKFTEQEKALPNILQYFTPAEYQMEKLGFKEFIHKPVRNALMDFGIEYEKKVKLVHDTKNKYPKVDNDVVYKYLDKGIPKGNTPEILKAKEYRKETEEMLGRLNEVRKIEGKPPIKGLQNYVLHALQPEVLTEIYEKGTIPLELAKVMEHIPPHTVFLRTAQHRKGVPADWLIKDPDKLMQMMYAIDLRYIHLQKALKKIEPYLKAVKHFPGDETKGVKAWSDEAYRYVKDWTEQAVKMRPSQWDKLIDNVLENTLAPILRNSGIKVSHMPWRDLQSFLSVGAHTGALGMRVKPIFRNLIQSTFDYVMYGTKNYLKGSAKFITPEGQKILKQSKVWQTRAPFEAQEKAMIGKVFRAGSIGYRYSDLHNVGKGILTRYYHGRDVLKMNHQEALDWADNDLPATQWSYRREDLPRAYWTTTGRAFWTLGSWWMNYYFRFLPEMLKRTFKGVASDGRAVSSVERFAGLRFLLLGGALLALKEATEDVVDYTGQVKPSAFREAPIANLGRSLIEVYNGFASGDDRQLNKGLRTLARTAKIFIPFYLAGDELVKLLKGEKELEEFLFYSKKRKRRKGKKKSKLRLLR